MIEKHETLAGDGGTRQVRHTSRTGHRNEADLLTGGDRDGGGVPTIRGFPSESRGHLPWVGGRLRSGRAYTRRKWVCFVASRIPLETMGMDVGATFDVLVRNTWCFAVRRTSTWFEHVPDEHKEEVALAAGFADQLELVTFGLSLPSVRNG